MSKMKTTREPAAGTEREKSSGRAQRQVFSALIRDLDLAEGALGVKEALQRLGHFSRENAVDQAKKIAMGPDPDRMIGALHALSNLDRPQAVACAAAQMGNAPTAYRAARVLFSLDRAAYQQQVEGLRSHQQSALRTIAAQLTKELG